MMSSPLYSLSNVSYTSPDMLAQQESIQCDNSSSSGSPQVPFPDFLYSHLNFTEDASGHGTTLVPDNTMSPFKNISKRPKRKQVKTACVNCQKACKKCDEGRPCQRCIKYQLTATCKDAVRKPRKTGLKRGPYKRRNNARDTATQISTATNDYSGSRNHRRNDYSKEKKCHPPDNDTFKDETPERSLETDIIRRNLDMLCTVCTSSMSPQELELPATPISEFYIPHYREEDERLFEKQGNEDDGRRSSFFSLIHWDPSLFTQPKEWGYCSLRENIACYNESKGNLHFLLNT